MKLTLTPLLTHVFASIILKRFFVTKTVIYFVIQLFGLFVYEFTVYDLKVNNASYTIQAQFIGGLRFILPSIYTYKPPEIKDEATVFYF